MSIVVNVISSSYSLIAYDGRALRNGNIVTESQEKALMVNDSVCIGYTGNLDFDQKVINNLMQYVVDLSCMKSDIVAAAVFKLLSIAKSQLSNVPSSSFLITGINGNGKMASYALGTNNSFHEIVPANNQLLYAFIGSDALDFTSYIQQNYKKQLCEEDSIKAMMHDYIISVAKLDQSVNTNIRFKRLGR